jgi:hypothetical protein
MSAHREHCKPRRAPLRLFGALVTPRMVASALVQAAALAFAFAGFLFLLIVAMSF